MSYCEGCATRDNHVDALKAQLAEKDKQIGELSNSCDLWRGRASTTATENARLRNELTTLRLENGELRSQVQQQDAEIGWLKDQLKNDPNGTRGVMCVYCGQTVEYKPAEGIQAAIDAAVNHDQRCPSNPIVKQIATLTAERDKLRGLLARTTQYIMHHRSCEIWSQYEVCSCDHLNGAGGLEADIEAALAPQPPATPQEDKR